MKKSALSLVALSVVVTGFSLAVPAEARHHHYRSDRGHGNCLRFNKTTGTVAGAVGGGLLGRAAFGGAGGLLGGAAVGGLAGHELSNDRRKHC